jgi:hypothetical protein
MKTATDLATSIEQLVRDHLAEIHRSTAAALERAFASSAVPGKATPKPPVRRPASNRREPDEVAALAERLHSAVCAAPGETMAVLAERLGTTASALNRPMNNLRRAGRLRSAGVRSQTRYFPAVGRAASSRAG